jgi:predicted transcriptional regulator
MLGAIFGTAASIAGNLASNNNIDKQIAEQRRENQANRDWNLNLAKLQNSWNIDQWNRENAYNSPSSQMVRYKQAGLNPDLIYGQQNLSAASPEMTSGDGSQPTDVSNLANKRTIGDIVAQASQTRLTNAQAKLAESQADKTDKETEGQGYQNEILKSDAAFRDALNSGTVQLNNMSLKVSEKGMQLTDEQITKVRKECVQIDQSIQESRAAIDEIRQKISNLKTDQAISRLRYLMDAKLNEATIKKLASECNLNYIQAKKIVDLLPYEISSIQASTSKTRTDTTVALDSLSTAAVTRAVLGEQSLELSLKNNWNAQYLESINSESKFILECLIRTNGYLK